MSSPENSQPPHITNEWKFSRRTLLRGGAVAFGAGAVLKCLGGAIDSDKPAPQSPDRDKSEFQARLERKKTEFERMPNAELARWILDTSGEVATAEQPVRTPENTPAYEDLRNTVEGKPAYRNTLLKLDGKKIEMDTWISRDILMFRALLSVALQDPANYFEGKPILIQSGQLTNRSGSHSGRSAKSHFFGSSIDFSGAIIDGNRSDEDPRNLYQFDSAINRQLGKIADTVGALVGVQTSGDATSLERVDSLQGTPGLSEGHYHFNASTESAEKHAVPSKKSIEGQLLFETTDPNVDLRSASISQQGRDFIHTYETFREKTYGDAHPGGTLTIGYGATYYLEGTIIKRNGVEVVIEEDNQKPRMGDQITKQAADELSKKMIERQYLKPVTQALDAHGMQVTQHQLDALVSYSFHRGGGNVVKLIERVKELVAAGHGTDALAIRAAFMYDINDEDKVKANFRNGVADRYLDTADMFIGRDYARQNRSFDARAWGVIIAAYFK